MATPLGLWLFSENTGTAIGDTSTGTAVNLALTPGAGSAWGTNSGGVLYNFAGTATCESSGGAGGLGKIATALAGATKMSIEFEVDISSSSGSQYVFYVGGQFGNWAVSVVPNAAGTACDVNFADGLYSFAISTGRHRIQVDIDTNGGATLCAKLWFDSSSVSPSFFFEPTTGAALDLNCSTWSDNLIWVGHYGGGNVLNGKLSILAIYSALLTGSDATAHNTAIAANNDANPNSGGGVSVALTGLAATTGRGTLAPAWSKALTGLAATSAGGTSSPGVAPPLVGRAATTSGGTTAPAVSKGLTGLAASSAGGTVTPPGGGSTAALTGQAVTVSGGTMTPAVSAPLTGASATASGGTAAPGVAPPLAGASASAAGGILGPAWSKALTGLAATVGRGTLSPGISVNLTGNSATTSQGGIAAAVVRALTGLFTSIAGGAMSSGFVPAQTLRPPFVAVVDDASTTVVAGSQQLTVTPSDQSLTVTGDT